jgi:predicted ATPase
MWICGLVLIVALVLTPRVGEARLRHAPEVDRPAIQEQVQAGGTVLPWHEREAYTQFMLERPIQSYLEHVPSVEPVFSDRGILDTNAWIQKAPVGPQETEESLLTFRRELKRRTMCDIEPTAHTALNDLPLR